MRIRATVAAASGAIALTTALTAPAAQAGEAVKPASALPVISKVSVNGGKDTVLGTTAPKTITLSVTASHASGIVDGWVLLWHGTDLDEGLDGVLVSEGGATCKNANVATTATCSLTLTIDPRTDLPKNKLAGSWHILTGATAGDGSSTYYDSYATARVQRLSKLTVNAAPEPVKKGGTITVTGKLSRANWEDHAYHGYTGQPVKLQFRKKTSSTYTTVRTIRTNSTGNLKTTVKASVDGYWRYSFAGTSTTPAVTTAGDFVDVK
ncbi:calcium-binding protein [Streptomyces sp. NPDC058409]|uniref:calcium-binding protein n=1 Tax=Streptomyces sp. NPDC058409 TaxID=3346484 RepID=UPI003650785C